VKYGFIVGIQFSFQADMEDLQWLNSAMDLLVCQPHRYMYWSWDWGNYSQVKANFLSLQCALIKKLIQVLVV